MKYPNIREEELKNKIAQDYFWQYDCTKIIGNVDFCVCMHQSQKELFEQESLLWAEAKKESSDIYKSFVQLILTIGKARTFDKNLPPAFLGAFDGEKMAFIPYNEIHEVFYLNDFNWNVTPSNYETKEFKLLHKKVSNIIDNKTLIFDYLKDGKELEKFIKDNFVVSKFGLTKTKIDKNNFTAIYTKWLDKVKPTIAVNWDIAKKKGIIDGDFYLADLLSEDNKTLKESLFVLLKHDHYELDRSIDDTGMFNSKRSEFTDKQVAHTQFWNRYERPPEKEEYREHIALNRHLLVPQDVRERKGSFFTPQIWVELSQKYIADVLGEDWQDEYYVWDCAAGTGNLLAGLTNKYNIFASTLDKADVAVMHDRVQNGANLLEKHCFQFDFLNDDFLPKDKGGKLPDTLYEIINNPKKRKKLVVYINPPYAEAANYRGNKGKVSETRVLERFKTEISFAANELFAQFFARIYKDIPSAKLASFSTMKYIIAPNFTKFREFFNATYKKGFVVRANTFDNVKGQFPIGFLVWDMSEKAVIESVICDVIDNDGQIDGQKTFSPVKKGGILNDWLRRFYDDKKIIGYLRFVPSDFQNNRGVYITSQPKQSDVQESRIAAITAKNLIEFSIYCAMRSCMQATWLNDRDQFLYPNDGWKTDLEFQNDCLAYTLFNNNIQSKYGTNNWIPFTEYQVGARDNFKSRFMTDFIAGKTMSSVVEEPMLFGRFEEKGGGGGDYKPQRREFSETARTVFQAGKELWKYYHKQPNCNVNASLYDIREYFQGRNEKGKMNNKSDDETYNELIGNLRLTLKILAKKIEPKVFEYGFLKE